MIEQIFETIEKKEGFLGGILKVFEIEENEIKANINLMDWKVIIEIGKNLKNKENIIKDVILHEVAHWKICPKDIINHYKLFEIVYKDFKGEYANYILNAFEDLIVNAYNKIENPPYEGQGEFFKIQISKGNSKFYKFFVILNLYLWDEKERINEFFKDFDLNKKEDFGILKDVEEILKVWKLPLNSDEKILYLKNSLNWEKMLTKFLEKCKKYFDYRKIPLSGFDSTFEKESKKEENIEKYLIYKLKEGKTPSFLSRFEFLDTYYRLNAPPIFLKPIHKEKFEIPLLKYGKEKFDINENSFFEINWKTLFFDPFSPFKNRINFYVNPFNFGIKIKGGTQKGIPDILFILDSSGSMLNSPSNNFPFGEKYHNAILGIYAILSFLKKIGIAPYIKYSLIQFSSKTISTGWLSYYKIKKLKERIFSPEGGTTKFDINVLEKILLQNKNEKFILFITDSEIFNFYKIKEKLIQLLSKNYTFFFQMGEPGIAYEILKSKFNYIRVEKFSDLSGKMIEGAKNVYL